MINPCAFSAEDDFRDVRQEVADIKFTYYQLGRELGLPPRELDSIRTAYHQLIDQAFDEVLLVWLRQRYRVERYGPPTWQRLVEAVDSPNGGNHPALAMDIANRHPAPGMIRYYYTLSLHPPHFTHESCLKL